MIKNLKGKELSPRQKEIVLLIAKGLANKQIASELNFSEKTVKNHVSRIFEKLHILSRQEVIVYAYENKLIIPQYLENNKIQKCLFCYSPYLERISSGNQ